MRFLRFLLVVPLIALMVSVSPAYAGKDKTIDAWGSQMSTIKDSVKDKAALAKAAELNSKMNDGYNDMGRSDYYALASKMFKELTELSKKNGGGTVYTPAWID